MDKAWKEVSKILQLKYGFAASSVGVRYTWLQRQNKFQVIIDIWVYVKASVEVCEHLLAA